VGEFGFIGVEEENFVTFLEELPGEPAADASGGAGDEEVLRHGMWVKKSIWKRDVDDYKFEMDVWGSSGMMSLA
jgi:hypothetical protein